ncbi:28S ribosomal protein S2, mitochondrial-like [Hydractinia symbiolongicarpus]|uniref:28S ribosomal protein S2, mitochondrial-like n=1 Tax=Hydractinia symbiolongicarpus TaxID=13093 RepID=UPI00254D52A9|nr:28S ribosomal protein S2, mitochondrial-like [Hydractinia symbiolongicarpus]
MTTNPRYDYLIQKTARASGEYFVTRGWQKGMLTNSYKMLGTDRLPDLIIAFNLSRFERIREAITESAMCNIPTIGIIDTDCDPRLITYPVPGNDDTPESVELFCDIFKRAILNAKQQRDIDGECAGDGDILYNSVWIRSDIYEDKIMTSRYIFLKFRINKDSVPDFQM